MRINKLIISMIVACFVLCTYVSADVTVNGAEPVNGNNYSGYVSDANCDSGFTSDFSTASTKVYYDALVGKWKCNFSFKYPDKICPATQNNHVLVPGPLWKLTGARVAYFKSGLGIRYYPVNGYWTPASNIFRSFAQVRHSAPPAYRRVYVADTGPSAGRDILGRALTDYMTNVYSSPDIVLYYELKFCFTSKRMLNTSGLACCSVGLPAYAGELHVFYFFDNALQPSSFWNSRIDVYTLNSACGG